MKTINKIILHTIGISIIVTGIVLTIIYKYNIGLEILTNTHELISIDTYNHLFKLKLIGALSYFVGMIYETILVVEL